MKKLFTVNRVKHSDYSEYKSGRNINGGCYVFYTTAYLVNNSYELVDSSSSELIPDTVSAEGLTLRQALACFNLRRRG